MHQEHALRPTNRNATFSLESSRCISSHTHTLCTPGNGFKDAVELLLSVDPPAAPNKISRMRGHTPVYLAAQNGHLECLHALIRHKADVNLSDTNGLSALYIACLNGHVQCARALIDAGAYGVSVTVHAEPLLCRSG
jgi:ankyrin repeat protein